MTPLTVDFRFAMIPVALQAVSQPRSRWQSIVDGWRATPNLPYRRVPNFRELEHGGANQNAEPTDLPQWRESARGTESLLNTRRLLATKSRREQRLGF